MTETDLHTDTGVIKPVQNLANSKRSRLQDDIEALEGNNIEDEVRPLVEGGNATSDSTKAATTTESDATSSEVPITTFKPVAVTSAATTTTTTTTTTSTTEKPSTQTTTTRKVSTSAATTSTSRTTTAPVAASNDSSLPLAYDRGPWMPVVVREPLEDNGPPVPIDLPHPIIPWTGHNVTPTNFVAVRAGPGVALNATELDEPAADEGQEEEEYEEYEEEEEEDEGPTASPSIPSQVKLDRIIDVGSDSKESADSTEKTTASTKFSFLQWFNERINNPTPNPRPDIRPTPSPLSPQTGQTRFFTLKPTAISYSGLQPVTRPRPSVVRVPTSTSQTIISNVGSGSVPAPFQIQTVLSVSGDRVAARPAAGGQTNNREQKSMTIIIQETADEDTQRSLRDSTSSKDPTPDPFKDFFPPVRRPTSRPLNKLPLNGSGHTNLPIEGLFTTLKPVNNGSKSTNSPIYTFKLNQGQSVHQVLTRLLADLTTGGSPATFDLHTGSVTSSHFDPSREQPPAAAVADERLRPWSNVPFRPSILNNVNPVVTKTTGASIADKSVITTEISNDILHTSPSTNWTALETSTLNPNGKCCHHSADLFSVTCPHFSRCNLSTSKVENPVGPVHVEH